jgi:signal transduction histidine kinase
MTHHLSASGFGFHIRNRAVPDEGSRLVLRLYAVLAGGLGTFLFAWGPMWLDDLHLAGQPFGRAALVRVAGALVAGAACCAAGFASVDDAHARHRCLAWFIGAHAIVFLAFLLQRVAIWGPGLADQALWLVLACGLLLALGEYQYPVVAVMRMLGASGEWPSARLRAAHERQIRDAAGQQERNRLARELHDSIKQQIFAIQTAAATAQVRFESDAAGARLALEQIREAARDAMTEMEVMLDQLRAVPLANAGLVAALKKLCEAVGLQTGAQVDFTVGNLPPDGVVPSGTQQAILRVAQEALANVARHARARHVAVALDSAASCIRLRVEDDGAGIVPGSSGGGAGLGNMATRASEVGGALDVTSRPARPPDAAGTASSDDAVGGTLVRFSVPFRESSRSRSVAWIVSCGVLLAGSLAGMRSRPDVAAAIAAVAAVGLVWSTVRSRRMRSS